LSFYLKARKNKGASTAVKDVLLKVLGDGVVASFQIPFSSSNFSDLFRSKILIISDPLMIKTGKSTRKEQSDVRNY
jgi:hypothetical protein